MLAGVWLREIHAGSKRPCHEGAGLSRHSFRDGGSGGEGGSRPPRDRAAKQGMGISTPPPSLKLWRTGMREEATAQRGSGFCRPARLPGPLSPAKCQRTRALQAPHSFHITTVLWECNIYLLQNLPRMDADSWLSAGRNQTEFNAKAQRPKGAARPAATKTASPQNSRLN